MAKLSFIVESHTGEQMLVYRSADEIGAPLATLGSVASEAAVSLVDGHGLPSDVKISVSGPWEPTNAPQAANTVTFLLGEAYACEGELRHPRPIGRMHALELPDMLRSLDAIAAADAAAYAN